MRGFVLAVFKAASHLNKGNNICIVCGSTWEKDEKILLKYIKESKNNNIKWIIAPHDVSKDNIERISRKIESKFLIYSKINKNNVHGNILIIDTIGDLKSIYNYSLSSPTIENW